MYNVEDYITECIESLVTQSAAEICEFLLVDDGSTDRTAELAGRAAARHSCVRLLHKENGGPGPGSARNLGLDTARGEYVMFCDGDDLLESRAVERLANALEEYGVDLAVGATRTFPQARSWLWSSYFEPGQQSVVDLEERPDLIHNAAPGNKMFRRSMLVNAGLRFAEGIHHQDTYVTIPAMLAAEKLALVGDVVQLYRKRESGDSIMDGHFTRPGNYWDHLQVIEHLSALLPSVAPGRRELLHRFLARSFQGFALRAPGLLPRHEIRPFFERASAVISQLPGSVLQASTHDPAHRAAYVLMRAGNLEKYRELPQRAERLVARGGRLYIDVCAIDAAEAELVEVGKLRGQVTGLTAAADALVLDLSLEIRRGPQPLDACNTVLLRCHDETSGRRLVAECVPRPDRAGSATAVLPRSTLASGSYQLRVAVVTRSGQASAGIGLAEVDQGHASSGVRIALQGREATVDLRDERGRAVLTVTCED